MPSFISSHMLCHHTVTAGRKMVTVIPTVMTRKRPTVTVTVMVVV